MDSKKIYLTKEGLEELKKEYGEFTKVKRPDVLSRVSQARSMGDLSENAEYDAAKEAQQHLELKIAKLEQTLSRAKIIQASDLPNDKIYILTRVKLKDLKTDEIHEYLLVSPEESKFEENKISVTSPIGKALLGKVKGETVDIKVPAGLLKYKIIDITR